MRNKDKAGGDIMITEAGVDFSLRKHLGSGHTPRNTSAGVA
ncbi:hypothetical protein [Streptomyces violaceusniger]|nr:hypothetical protein [Streptomyces hygroscopicus]